MLVEEVFPGLPSQTQRERLRDRLRDIRTDLPESLANSIVQGNDAVGFDPTGWAIDALELRGLARTASSAPLESPLGSGSGLEHRWSGTLLQEWEDLERVTEGRGASHELIGDLCAFRPNETPIPEQMRHPIRRNETGCTERRLGQLRPVKITSLDG